MRQIEERAETAVRDLERITPYVYEGLYGNFIRAYMESDKSRWTADLSRHLSMMNQDWNDVCSEIASLLWDRFERKISC
ncbi:MAG: hypothetical protein V2B18_03845 [Pseudomonadota bacterium]